MTLEELAKKLVEKNPSLIRDLVESEYIKIELLEMRQGRVVKCEIIKKHYKEGDAK